MFVFWWMKYVFIFSVGIFTIKSPMILSMCLVGTVMGLSFTLYYTMGSSWMPCVLVLIILGGMMILFLYLSSLTEIMFSFNMIKSTIIFFCLSSLLLYWEFYLSMNMLSYLFSTLLSVFLLLLLLITLFSIILILTMPTKSLQYFV